MRKISNQSSTETGEIGRRRYYNYETETHSTINVYNKYEALNSE